jgi:hypothetical protein
LGQPTPNTLRRSICTFPASIMRGGHVDKGLAAVGTKGLRELAA